MNVPCQPGEEIACPRHGVLSGWNIYVYRPFDRPDEVRHNILGINFWHKRCRLRIELEGNDLAYRQWCEAVDEHPLEPPYGGPKEIAGYLASRYVPYKRPKERRAAAREKNRAAIAHLTADPEPAA